MQLGEHVAKMKRTFITAYCVTSESSSQLAGDHDDKDSDSDFDSVEQIYRGVKHPRIDTLERDGSPAGNACYLAATHCMIAQLSVDLANKILIIGMPLFSESLSSDSSILTVSKDSSASLTCTSQLLDDSEVPTPTQHSDSESTALSLYDVGNIVNGKVKLKDLSKYEKYCYLKHHSVPKRKDLITQEVVRRRKKKTLVFQLSWLKKFTWLAYSCVAGGGLCKFCVLFPPVSTIDGTLVTKPFTNLNKACGKSGKLQTHGNLGYHRTAATKAQGILSTINNPERTLLPRLTQHTNEQYQRNLHVLSVIVRAVLFCGRQNIALRGHRDDQTSSSGNKGNFIALLDLIANFDERLNHHLEFGKKNCRYTSKTIQNQLITIIGNIIREEVTADLRVDDAVVSIIADEVTSKHSNQEILAVCLRFVTWLDKAPLIKEVFVDFCFLKNATGLAIANAIKHSLASHNVDISKVRGQAYDGASAMSSDRCGVQARIRDSAPLAVYTHCRSHVLNLSIASSCKLPEIRNMIDGINSVFLFYDLSPKRQRFLELILETKSAPTRKKHLYGLCKTRWVERHTCFDTFEEMYEYVCISLEAITFPHRHPDLLHVKPGDPDSDQWNWQRDRDTVTQAQGLFANLQKAEFIMAFVVVKNCLRLMKGMTVKLQKRDIDVISAYNMIEGIKKQICDLRKKLHEEHKEWFEEAKKMADKVGMGMEMPRVTGRQMHRSNAGNSTAVDYYRVNYSTKFVDHLQTEFNNRFSNENQVGINLLHILPAHLQTLKEADLDKVVSDLKFWESDLTFPGSLKGELKDWFQTWQGRTSEDVPATLLEALKQCDSDVYPCIHRLLTIGCTLPVTSCEAERSFSTLRRTMNHLRSSMGEERLAALTLMNMHSEIEISPDKVVQKFIAQQPRRLFKDSILFD